ncbi:armadillo-type protein [Globomyces pollinis-pini]|nr:armadillo-type protein [Globomyces pollinis-pini]
MATQPTQLEVLEALNTLYIEKSTNGNQRREASKWLAKYQKMSIAWQISDNILRMDAPIEMKVFSAQTFRQKIEFDLLSDLPGSNDKVQLRDNLVDLCNNYRSVRSINTQLCIALADLAIQMPEWSNPVDYMIETFGKSAETLSVLLEFLYVLPEELAYNTKINLEPAEFKEKTQSLIEMNATKVLSLLFSFLQMPDQTDNGVTLSTLSSWIRTGNLSFETIEQFSLINLAFESLKVPQTFDTCAEMVSELIWTSTKNGKNEKMIQAIYPHLIGLGSFLKENVEDPDIVRGICRIFVDAAEAYSELIVNHLEAFQGILEGLLLCSSNEDIEIVKITRNSWYLLAEELSGPEKLEIRNQFLPVYRALVDITIKHMRYPNDFDGFSSQEKDDFRDFRHDMGDVLKDCIRILGEDATLPVPYNLLANAFESARSGNGTIVWQDIEAPLFSLRTMSSSVSLTESTYIPRIMEMLPNLPPHPRIKYAAILVIGRYSLWSNNNPSMLSFQLDFVSNGFQAGENDTNMAAARTFKDLCKNCNKHLVNYLAQLHPFYTQTMLTVQPADQRDMSEAVSHLLAAVPRENLGEALSLFVSPTVTTIHNCLNTAPDRPTMVKLKASIEELATLVQFIDSVVPPEEPHPLVQYMEQIWPVIEQLFTSYGHEARIAESICRLFRYFLETTKLHSQSILSSLVTLMMGSFQQTKLSCYIWMCTKCIKIFGTEEQYQNSLGQLVEQLTSIVMQMNQEAVATSEEPDLGILIRFNLY